jgi:type II secretory pathway component PulC
MVVEATKHLRLVGISWSDDPDIMIEDTKTQRTLFLKKGKLIDNEIKVQAVFKDKVILSYNGEEIELR